MTWTSIGACGAVVSLAIALTAGRAQETAAEQKERPWTEILGQPQGSWPEPLPELEWRAGLRDALDEARETGRPLLIIARCVPCKQCATIDRQVLEGGPELTPLLLRFVTVRLTDATELDLDLLPVDGFQDLDVSWWVWFLSPEGRVYGVFGGRDEVSDATRVSKAALVQTLRRVLDHHADPRRVGWDVDGSLPTVDDEPRSARELPAHDAWFERSPDAWGQNCMHCHQVAEILRQPAIDDGTFDKRKDLFVWPYPENVGLRVDRDHGLLVDEVTTGSPAAEAGLRVGDELAMAAGRRLFGQTDLRAALHRAARPAETIELAWTRGGELHDGKLVLGADWRETVLDWRMSVSQGNVGASPGFFPLPGPRQAVGAEHMAVSPFFGRRQATSPAFGAGLRPGHVIVAVDGESPNLASRPFLTWFRMQHEPGDDVELTVLEGELRRTIRYRVGP